MQLVSLYLGECYGYLMDALGRTGGGVLLVGNGVAVNHTFAR